MSEWKGKRHLAGDELLKRDLMACLLASRWIYRFVNLLIPCLLTSRITSR